MSSIKERNSEYRSDLFRHLDGIAVAPVAASLKKRGVLDFLMGNDETELQTITNHFHANAGYLNVSLRILAAQGWINYHVNNEEGTVTIELNEKSRIAFSCTEAYEPVVELMHFSGRFHNRKFEKEPYEKWLKIAGDFQKGLFDWSSDELELSIQRQIQKHIEGVLVGPTTVLLGMGGMFHKYFMETSFSPGEYHKDPESFGQILDFLSYLGWFEKNRRTYTFTEKGLFYAKRSSAYGVTVSYIPTFRQVDELIFGDPTVLKVKEGEPEIGVDREMNVWGSGGAHVAYFKKVDEIIIDIFNRPIDEQPIGILDMGCGNGAFLIHIFDVIFQHTRRGEVLDEYPLFMVGADYNEAALKVTRSNLINADVWAKVIRGDIGDPERLANDLDQDYGIDLGDLLNVRTFLDHNRMWEDVEVSIESTSISAGAFAYEGRLLSNNEVESNLKSHLMKWLPYIKKFGLVMIELHSLGPALTAANLGKTAATAYEATHGFSDQYILELPSFDKVVKEVGLKNDERYRAKFPNSELATVSINYLID